MPDEPIKAGERPKRRTLPSPRKKISPRAAPWTLSNLPPDPEYVDAPEAISASAALDKLLATLRLDDHLRNRAIRDVWPLLVGPQMAVRSFPDSFKRGVLTVRVADPATRHHLHALRRELMEALARKLGDTIQIKEIRFMH